MQRRLLGSGLTDLLLQLLAGVANTLVLVRVGLAERAHVSSNLTDFLPVDTGDGAVSLLGVDLNRDAGGQRKLDGVRVAQGEHHHVLTLQLSAVSDTDDVNLFVPASGNTGDRIED